ncbi:MAG: response regulator [Oligoflexia bacterium]|nr:response regulator [Oligoflexia bacterium]
MEETNKLKKFILGIDDDNEITSILQIWLDADNYSSRFTHNSVDFIKEFEINIPSLCIVDINIEDAYTGFKLIKQIRDTYNQDIPILCLSALSDGRSIAHAIELGANDYIVKPPSRIKFLEKCQHLLLSNKQSLTSTIESKSCLYVVPGQFSDIELLVNILIEAIDECGLIIRSKYLIQKGAVVKINSPMLEEITKKNTTTTKALLTVCYNWAISESNEFGAYLEFDLGNQELMNNVRSWIMNKKGI